VHDAVAVHDRYRLVENATATRILDSCFEYLKRNSPFLVQRRFISIISGRDEGALGWLAINYLSRRLRGQANHTHGTLGAIEMGGASSQVTVEIDEHTAVAEQGEHSSSYVLRLGPQVYRLYTHSYLEFGMEAARERYNEAAAHSAQDPCLPLGFTKELGRRVGPANAYHGREVGDVMGTGNLSACWAAVQPLFASERPCLAEPCTFAGVYQPEWWRRPGHGGMVLFENFFHSASQTGVRGLEEGVSIDALLAKGREYCARPFEEILQRREQLYPAMEAGTEPKCAPRITAPALVPR
jgi:Golgi nucleoside diphosphatase